MSAPLLRELLEGSFVRALDRIDLAERVARAMPRPPASVKAMMVLAVGKAAGAMARGALSVPESRIARAVVVEPEGAAPSPQRDARVERLVAPHPDPDRRSVAAALLAIDLVRASEFTVALVSGGASSLLCLPRGISLARYVRVVRRLLLGGATVREVNIVRRHLCAVKGGGLARVARGPLHTLVASDVIGGGLHDVGSGPTVADPSTCAQARAVLRRFAPRLAAPPLHESLKPAAPRARALRANLIAWPDDLARAVARELQAGGMTTRILEASVAPAAELAREYVWLAGELRPGEALVRAAEPSLRVNAQRPGLGGRSTHLALLVARGLPEGVAFLAGASDGVDGTSGTAGAVVDASLSAHVSPVAIARAVAAFDTAPMILSAGMALTSGPTSNNLADVHVLAREAAR
jgi:glycerate 2-kinase